MMRPISNRKVKRTLKNSLKPGSVKKILYDEGSLPFILETLGMEINKSGFVVEKATQYFVLDAEGWPFQAKDLMGIMNK